MLSGSSVSSVSFRPRLRTASWRCSGRWSLDGGTFAQARSARRTTPWLAGSKRSARSSAQRSNEHAQVNSDGPGFGPTALVQRHGAAVFDDDAGCYAGDGGIVSGWTVEDAHGNASGVGMTREQATRAAAFEAQLVGATRYAVGPSGEVVPFVRVVLCTPCDTTWVCWNGLDAPGARCAG